MAANTPGNPDEADMNEVPPRREIDAVAMKGLAHPLRMRIWEAFGVHGEATASMLGRLLGESSGATSYHLRQLARFGFVEEVPEQPTARERWWRRYPGGWSMSGFDFMRRPETRPAASFVLDAMMRGREERYRQWLAVVDSDHPRIRAWSEVSYDTTSQVRMTREEAAQLNGELNAVLGRWSPSTLGRTRAARPDTVMVEVQINLFPHLVADPAVEERRHSGTG
ncbi:winged helix-turn-helix domain-containing protein [Murinocardiopsis flavida]|nr:helix-turn-helix domain-containing protein [Murinocardiopsis flavida]